MTEIDRLAVIARCGICQKEHDPAVHCLVPVVEQLEDERDALADALGRLHHQHAGAVEALEAITAARFGAPGATDSARLKTVVGYAREVLNRLGGQ